MNRETAKSFMYLMITYFLWGSMYVFSCMLSSDIPEIVTAAVRCGIGLFPMLFMGRRELGKVKVKKGDWKYFLSIGFFGYYLCILLTQIGTVRAGSAVSALINSLSPIIISLLAVVILHEKMTIIKTICLVLSIGSAVIISGGAADSRAIVGILLVLLSCFCWGFATIAIKKVADQYSAAFITAYGLGISMIFFIPSGIAAYIRHPAHFSGRDVIILLLLGVFSTALSQYTNAKSLEKLPASTCCMFFPLQPAFAVLQGMVLLHETPGISFFIAFILLVADILLCVWSTAKEHDI